MEFIAYGGGYLITKDFYGNPSPPHIYRTSQSSYEVCMRRDSSAPKHCLEDNSCTNNELILFENRITKSADIDITLKGWFDPYLNAPEEASGIQSYSITIHDMKEVDESTLSMDESSISTLNISSDVDSIQLPDKQPALYGVSLNILDNAGNFKQARRFVLFDNSSKILINAGNKLKVYTGNKATNFTWQTNHGKICVHWAERYYNSFHVHHNLLRQIKADYHNLYNGVYEQYNGQLPVKGTPNLHGILEFRYVFAINSRVLDNKTAPNFLNQSVCEKYSLRDGETYDVTIIPRDVMNNTVRETIAVHIDASVPDIVEMYLIKDGMRHLFVHNSSDLSRMTISFKALDEHSGLYSIEWMLGTSPDGGELGRGSMAVNRLEPGETCNHVDNCYCPKVGVCEKAMYSVKFNSLIKNNKQKGHHNRGYFFTVKVTNNAMLVSISRTDILADDSPPASGIAMEGETGSQEMDYTCNREIIVRWSGFIDHESGIKKYRVGFDDKCLSREGLLHNNHTTLPGFIYETNKEQIKVLAPYPGLYFTSVIAYNYALEASEVVCSNGITYDISPPKLYNIILEEAKTTEGIACYNRTAWLILQNFTAVKLDMTQACRKICNDSSNEFPLLENMLYVKQEHSQGTSYADSICKKLGAYDKNMKTYIP
ncbi:uncharacterized protein LOC133182735, partial [Saccostrea echinata]|uniref:uncharacterized protein LOC133182735 n=1 Tax=Saccostrea echinata TaxID=191078 RepID=UPI002A83C886